MAPPPTPQAGGGNVLTRKIGPLPIWAYGLVVVVGGVVLYIYYKRISGQNSSTASTPADPLNATNDPSIDPNTGVPYSIESMVDPKTGNPYYYENNPGAQQNTSGTPAPTGNPAPSPGPHPVPPNPTSGGPQPHNPHDPVPTGPPIRPAPPPSNPGPHPGPLPPVKPPQSPVPQPQFSTVTVRPWPQTDSSLWSIWQQNGRGISWSQWEQDVLRLNPQITNPNLIYPNEKIKVPA